MPSGIQNRAVSKYIDVLVVRTASIIMAMAAVSTSETSVYFKQATRRHIPEGYHLQTRRRQGYQQSGFSLRTVLILSFLYGIK
jgi:hypothetical protein